MIKFYAEDLRGRGTLKNICETKSCDVSVERSLQDQSVAKCIEKSFLISNTSVLETKIQNTLESEIISNTKCKYF